MTLPPLVPSFRAAVLGHLLHRRFILLGMFVAFLGVITGVPVAPTLLTFLSTLPPQEKQNGSEEWDSGNDLVPPARSTRQAGASSRQRPPQRRWGSHRVRARRVGLPAVPEDPRRRSLPRRTAPPPSDDPDEQQA